jgi:hypothetical protein
VMTIYRGLVVGVVLAGAAVTLAGPASAGPLSGDYTATVTDGGGFVKVGTAQTWTFTPCGPDCTHYQTKGTNAGDLHLQGNTWTGTNASKSGDCTNTLDNNSLVFTQACPKWTLVWQLAPNS